MTGGVYEDGHTRADLSSERRYPLEAIGDVQFKSPCQGRRRLTAWQRHTRTNPFTFEDLILISPAVFR